MEINLFNNCSFFKFPPENIPSSNFVSYTKILRMPTFYSFKRLAYTHPGLRFLGCGGVVLSANVSTKKEYWGNSNWMLTKQGAWYGGRGGGGGFN